MNDLNNENTDNIEVSNINPVLIGKGSYGKVYKVNDNICYKKINLFIYDDNSSQDILLVENNLKEVVFYKMLNYKIKNDKDNFTYSFFFDKDKEKIKHVPRPSHIGYIPELFLTNRVKKEEQDELYKKSGIKIFFQHYGIPLSKYTFTTKELFINIFSQICKVVLMFFKSNMSHGDLKPSNILLKFLNNENSISNVNIVDFGSVCFCHGLNLTQNYQRCTFFYTSPEEFVDDDYSFCNDWWSIGTIMFEYITGKYFIECLLYECNVKQKDINNFIKYSTSKNKPENFYPVEFMKEFYSNISQISINRCINKYIKDQDLKEIICLLLEINAEVRSLNINTILSLLKIEDNISISICASIENKDTLKEYSSYNLNIYTYETRKHILSGIYSICIGNKKFGKELFGHTIMLLDRFFFRIESMYDIYSNLENKNENKIKKITNLSPYKNSVFLSDPIISSLCCLAITAMLLKSEVIYLSNLKQICNEYFLTKVYIQELEAYFTYIFNVMDFNLFNLSPDMLIPYNVKKNYSKIFKIYVQYPVINTNCYNLLQLILE